MQEGDRHSDQVPKLDHLKATVIEADHHSEWEVTAVVKLGVEDEFWQTAPTHLEDKDRGGFVLRFRKLSSFPATDVTQLTS